MSRTTHTIFTALVLTACALALAAPTGCRAVFAQGSYERIGSGRLDSLPEAGRTIILSAIRENAEPAARARALWTAGQTFEADGQWRAALVAYEQAGATGVPQADAVERKVRWCRARLAVDARWADADLRRSAVDMDRNRGLGLYREVARTIFVNYVNEVEYASLVEAGLVNLRAAVASPLFAERFALTDDDTSRAEFLAALAALQRNLADETGMTSFAARYYVRRACEESARTVGLPDGVIISEFLFGALEHLDTYCSYLTPQMYAALSEELSGQFVGLGIEVRTQNEELVIVTVFDGGPASKADIRPGDVILAVDDERVAEAGMDGAIRHLRGEKGSTVSVELRRDGQAQTVAVTRGVVAIPSVRSAERLGQKKSVGYLHLVTFQQGTADELARTLDRLEDGGPLDGIVLDLRGNPGGLLGAAVDVCSLFLDKGKVVSTKGRGFAQTQVYRVDHWRFRRHDQPLVVLIDGSSASASEIVAAALRDHDRCTLVGERSFGKGIVQSLLPVELGRSAVYLTTARFYGPGDETFHGRGISPDVAVPGPENGLFRSQKADPATDPALARALELLATEAHCPAVPTASPVAQVLPQ